MLASVLSDRESRNYDYDLGFKFDADLADAYFASARAASPIREPDSITADYTAREDILAGYAQARFDLGATNVIVGVRVENTKFDGDAAKPRGRVLAWIGNLLEGKVSGSRRADLSVCSARRATRRGTFRTRRDC